MAQQFCRQVTSAANWRSHNTAFQAVETRQKVFQQIVVGIWMLSQPIDRLTDLRPAWKKHLCAVLCRAPDTFQGLLCNKTLMRGSSKVHLNLLRIDLIVCLKVSFHVLVARGGFSHHLLYFSQLLFEQYWGLRAGAFIGHCKNSQIRLHQWCNFHSKAALLMQDETHSGMTPAQLRAARALLGWSQEYLAAVAQVSKRTIASYELGQTSPNPSTYVSLIFALEDAGIEFIAKNGGGVGVRLRRE